MWFALNIRQILVNLTNSYLKSSRCIKKIRTQTIILTVFQVIQNCWQTFTVCFVRINEDKLMLWMRATFLIRNVSWNCFQYTMAKGRQNKKTSRCDCFAHCIRNDDLFLKILLRLYRYNDDYVSSTSSSSSWCTRITPNTIERSAFYSYILWHFEIAHFGSHTLDPKPTRIAAPNNRLISNKQFIKIHFFPFDHNYSCFCFFFLAWTLTQNIWKLYARILKCKVRYNCELRRKADFLRVWVNHKHTRDPYMNSKQCIDYFPMCSTRVKEAKNWN